MQRTPIKKHLPKLKPLDDIFSECVRRLAMENMGGCEYCGTKKTDWKELQCSHYVGRRNRHVRWTFNNCAGLCGGCHMYLDANPYIHTEWMKKRIGSDNLDQLVRQSQMTNKVNLDTVKENLTRYLEALI